MTTLVWSDKHGIAGAPRCRQRARHWWQTFAARFVRGMAQRLILRPGLAVLCAPLRIQSAEHLRGLNEPAIFVANHSSHFDTLLVLRALPPSVRRQVTVAAAKDYFYGNPLKGAGVSLLLNTFPFDRHDGQAALGTSADVIRDGWSLLLYPEGTRSQNGELQRFKRGVGELTLRTGATVVPVHIGGAHNLMSKGACFPHRTPVTVRIGAPVRYTASYDAISIANDLHQRVAALAEPGS